MTAPAPDPFEGLDAMAQAELVRGREVTPSELVEAAIARIERRNPELNAIIHPLFEAARTAAKGPLPDGPFRGVPFVVKDAVCQTAGDPYHLGSRFLKAAGWRAAADTELARRYRAAGFVFVGKSNTPEFATSPTTEPLAYGPTRNPWAPDRSPGGSSGGSAAAVASGMVAVAHGNDMGGSIRIPAGACGLVGLKPSRARNSLAPEFGEYWGPLTHEHVLTRSVRDTAAVLDATAGPAAGDPYMAPPPRRPWAREVGAPPGSLRIGFQTKSPVGPVDAECAAAVTGAARRLETLGHAVEEVQVSALDDMSLMGGFGIVMMSAVARDVERWSERLGRALGPDDLEPLNWMLAERGRELSATGFVAAVEAIQAYARKLCGWWEDGFDVLVTPTVPEVTPALGWLAPDVPVDTLMQRMASFTAFCAPFNASGQPAMSLPLHRTAEGVPVGVQLVAAYGCEDVLVRLGSQLESADPWPRVASTSGR